MNFLSIDLGDKRCGLAYSCVGVIFTLPFVPRTKLVRELKKLVIEKQISKIIIGIPYDIYGNDSKQLAKTKRFISKLKQIFSNIEIVEVDERFTTLESLSILKQFGDKKQIGRKKDSLSAYLILDRYLSRKST